MRVLIVEDELLNAMLMEDALRGRHEVVGMAPDPDEALRIAAAQQPDLCLADIRLRGGASGLDAARELYRRHGVRTLFVSGDCPAAAKAAMACEGAFGWLSKPFSEQDVLASVEVVKAIMKGEPPRRLPRRLELFR